MVRNKITENTSIKETLGGERERRVYRLSFVPSEASVDIDRESAGEVDGGDSKPGGECLECPIPSLTHYPHPLSLSMRSVSSSLSKFKSETSFNSLFRVYQ